MNRIIAEHWNKEKHELPGFNCIVYPTGAVTIVESLILEDSVTHKREYHYYPRCDTSIDSIEKYDAAYWTVVDEWVRIEHEGRIFIGGDGSMGNEGFIAHVDENDDLLWGIFFWDTNPIKELVVNNGILTAINEHSEVCIAVNLSNITEITRTSLLPSKS